MKDEVRNVVASYMTLWHARCPLLIINISFLVGTSHCFWYVLLLDFVVYVGLNILVNLTLLVLNIALLFINNVPSW